MPTISIDEPYVVQSVSEKVFNGISPTEVSTSVRVENGQEIYSARIRAQYINDLEYSGIYLPEVVVDNIGKFVAENLDEDETLEFMQDMGQFIALQQKLAGIIIKKREIV